MSNARLASIVVASCLLPAAAASARPVNLDRTVHVSPVAGNPVASGTRLLGALDGITTASADNPWLLRIEPGVYDLAGRSLVMKAYVDVEGSGEGVTTVRSTVDRVGTIQGAEHAELRGLTVVNTGAMDAYALVSGAATFAASRVTCLAQGGSRTTVGVVNFGAGGTFRDVTARAEGGDVATGFGTDGGLLIRVRAFASAPRFAYGVFSSASTGEMEDVTAEATGASYALGFRNEGGGPLLRNVRAIGRGGNISEGIVNGAGSAARIHGAVVDVTGGADFAVGIRNEFSSARVTGAAITVAGAGNAFGLTSSFSGTPSIANATFTVTATGAAVGIQADRTQTTVEASRVASSGVALRNSGLSPATSISVGASRVEGTVQPGAGNLRCAASYDGSFTALGANCLP